KSFECKTENISDCQCNGISFTPEEKTFIEEKYNDCLCRSCLLELKMKMNER
ncbi:MAG TPA: cysteine-rich CWC family protein, partial [Chitinophagaceae bacterium]